MEPNKYIDPVKTGKFIAKLRESHNWTQDELGAKIFISRKSVSKWETGKCCPSIDMLKKLSEVFGVSFDDLIAGEFVDDKGKAITGIKKIFYRKDVKIISFISLLLIFISLALFFIYNYNATKVYEIYYEDDNFNIGKGVIVLSPANNYISIGNFYSNHPNTDENTDYTITLYYKDDNNEKDLLIFSLKTTYFSDKDINNEIFTKTIKDNIDNLYLKIEFTNTKDEKITYNVKLNIEVNFKNNFVYSIKNNIITSLFKDKTPKLEIENVNVKEDFTTKAVKNDVNLKFLYDLSSEELEKIYNGKNINILDSKYKISYQKDSKTLILKNKDNIVSIILIDNYINATFDQNVICYINNDQNIFFEGKCNNYYYIIKEMINKLKELLKSY